MKKFFLFIMASLMTVSMMAVEEEGDGSTKANAKEFDWNAGVKHPGGKLWYRVDLAPLYDEENPSLTLYLTNPSNVVGSTVDVSMVATVAGQEESKDYTIAARQYKTYTANAKALITLRQKEIYLTLESSGPINLSAKVFESADLDETCRDAETLKWGVETFQNPMYSKWWRISLKDIKDTVKMKKDAKVTIKNVGTKTVHLKAGQSLDCPSSGTTRRDYDLAPNESVVDTIPQSMILSVQPDELYFGLENVESKISIRVDTIAQPKEPIIPGKDKMASDTTHVDPTDTLQGGVPAETSMKGTVIKKGTTLYRYSVKDLNAFAKYEPEFTYRNDNAVPAKVTVKMAFERPAFGTSNTDYVIAPGEEEVVVYKKNMLDGLADVDSIFLLTITDQPITFSARYKHVREGKACKTNIDFNWVDGHTQEARTTQWYAINVADARDRTKDIMVYLLNQGDAAATVKASMAFSCPYIDLTEMTRTISAKSAPATHRLGYSSYAMMSDTIWIGLETNQNIKFWADTVDAEKKAEVDYACEKAVTFDWKVGQTQEANDTVWYKINMDSVRNTAAKFPTIVVENLSSSSAAKISAEMSLECPDSIENQSRTLTIAAGDTYSRKMARNMFENIKQDSIYLRVVSTQKISIKIRLSEEAEGTSCASAIPFNWVSGNSQAANSNLWYKVDMREAKNKDLRLTIENKDAAVCEGVGQLTFGCPDEDAPSAQTFTLASKETKTIFKPHSATELLPDGDSSIIYINLQGNTAMRISAERLTPAPFTPITGPSTSLDTLLLDSKSAITQNRDTQWYLVPKEEIQHMRDTNKVVPLTPNIQIVNSDGSDHVVTIKAAFAFPITETMMSQKVKVSAGSTFVHALDYKLFSQVLNAQVGGKNKFDSILVCVEIPAAAAGKIHLQSSLDKAFNGNTRETAAPIIMGEEYIQDGNTTMWYKLKTADLKKDMASLINRRINVRTANKGTANTTITVAVYEGLASKVDMFEQFGLDTYREQTIKKGEDRSRSFPYQNILMVGDLELYIKVTTTQKISFKTKFDGEYAQIAEPDTMQYHATFLVPNVDYEVPGDNEYHWYQICIPYIRNNFKYVHESAIIYDVNGPATIEVLNTFMDTMKYNFPSKRTNKAKKHYTDTTYLATLLSKGIERASKQIMDKPLTFDITTFEEEFVDSLLHRYVTSDSITMYIRYKTDANMKVRLIMPQVTGDSCLNPVSFDWEHGYVNPAKKTSWIEVKLDSTMIPDTCDLQIHMENWAKGYPNDVEATLYVANCKKEDKIGTVKRTITTDTIKVLERQFLEEELGWSNFMIEYYSDSTTHIWAELIKPYKRDTDTIHLDTVYVCPYFEYTSKYDGNKKHKIDPDDKSTWEWTVWYDSINRQEAKIITCLMYFTVKPLQKPALIPIKSLTNKPTIKRGATISTTAATIELESRLPKGDSIMPIDTITWEYSYDNENFKDCGSMSVLTSASVALRYNVVTTCDTTFTSSSYINIPTTTLPTRYDCGPYTWPEVPGAPTYYRDTVVSDTFNLGVIGMDSIVIMTLKINPVVEPLDSIIACKQYTWPVNNETYYNDTTCVIKDSLMADGCYHEFTLKLTIMPAFKVTEVITACNDTVWRDGLRHYIDGEVATYTDTVPGGCDTIYTCTFTINTPLVAELPMVTKYGDRLLMINRQKIIDSLNWVLDLIEDKDLVRWYKEAGAPGDNTDDIYLKSDYYLTNSNGELNGEFIQSGQTYYAVIEIPGEKEGDCPRKAETKHYTVGKASAAPALVPSLARPGEEISVINLDPDQTTTIRIYTYEGLVRGSYTVTGKESYTIKAAMDNGFYLVELYSDSYKSTLRYIVK